MRVGVIGMGSVGERHARNLLALGHAVCFYDADYAVEQRLAAAFPEAAYATSLAALWELRPEAVFICTPPHAHARLIVEADALGAAIFCEKPLVADEAELGSLANRLWAKPSMVGCNLRYHPAYWVLHKTIQDGDLGEAVKLQLDCQTFLPDWVPGRDYKRGYTRTIGVTLDVGSHEVDLATWIMGPASLLAAHTVPANLIGLACDGAAGLVLAHQSGAWSDIHLDYLTPGYYRAARFVGKEGVAELFWGGKDDAWVATRREDGGQSLYQTARGYDPNQMYLGEVQDFLRCVAEGRPTPNELGEAIATARLLFAARGRGARHAQG